tara:strand:- start:65 stop:895 length:831 start_codon:yes stop_codon:yes gene_type:complete
MIHINKFISLFSIIFAFSFSGCGGTATETVEKFKFPTRSFVKFESKVYRLICTPDDPENYSSKCYQLVDGATGSASIVGEAVDGVYILTAGHMCDRRSDMIRFNKFLDREMEDPLLEKYYVQDIDLFQYNVKILDFNKEDDTCIGFAWGLFGPSLKLSNTAPKIGDRVYNMAAPAGFMEKGAVPLFEGIYFGDGKIMSLYTIPAIGGSSGSPILNEQAELVGLIYARHVNFHHITISPKYRNLIHFVVDNIRKDVESRNRSHSVPRLKGFKIKFGK